MAKFEIVSEYTVVETLHIEAGSEEEAHMLALESPYSLDDVEFGDRHVISVKSLRS